MTKATQRSNLLSPSIPDQSGYSSEDEVKQDRSCIPIGLRSCLYGRKTSKKIIPGDRNSTANADNGSLNKALQASLVFQENSGNSPDISASSSAPVHAFEDPRNSPDIRPESSIDQGHESSTEVEDLVFSDARKIWLFDYIVNQRNLRDLEINSRSPSPSIEEDLTYEQKIRAFDFMASSSQNNMNENGLKRYLNLGDFSDDQLPIDLRSQDRNSSGSEASRPMSFFKTKQPEEEFETIPARPSSQITRPTLPPVTLAQVFNLPAEDPDFPNDLKIKAFKYINEVAKLGFSNLDEVGKLRRFDAATNVIKTNIKMIGAAETFAEMVFTSSLGNSSALNDEEKIKLFDYFNEILKFKITDTPKARIDKLQRLMKTIYSNKRIIREKLDRRIAKEVGMPTNGSRQQ